MEPLPPPTKQTNRFPRKCSVFGCNRVCNGHDRSDDRFFRFSARNPEQRQLWIDALVRRRPDGGRSGWTPRKFSRVCSRHFVSGRPSKTRTDADYVPTIFRPLVNKTMKISMGKMSTSNVVLNSEIAQNESRFAYVDPSSDAFVEVTILPCQSVKSNKLPLPASILNWPNRSDMASESMASDCHKPTVSPDLRVYNQEKDDVIAFLIQTVKENPMAWDENHQRKFECKYHARKIKEKEVVPFDFKTWLSVHQTMRKKFNLSILSRQKLRTVSQAWTVFKCLKVRYFRERLRMLREKEGKEWKWMKQLRFLDEGVVSKDVGRCSCVLVNARLSAEAPLENPESSAETNSSLSFEEASLVDAFSPTLPSRHQRSCQECDFVTNQLSVLKNHINEMHMKSPLFRCCFCDYGIHDPSASSAHALLFHLQEKHGLQNAKIAKKPDEQSSQNTINLVIGSFKSVKCSKCDYSTSSKDELKKHFKTEHPKKQFQCKYCEYKASQCQMIDWHLLDRHLSKDGILYCDSCDFTTYEEDLLRLHLLTEHKEVSLYKCDRCSFVSITKDRVTRHFVLEHVVRTVPIDCPYCSFSSLSCKALLHHYRQGHVHPEDNRRRPKANVKIASKNSLPSVVNSSPASTNDAIPEVKSEAEWSYSSLVSADVEIKADPTDAYTSQIELESVCDRTIAVKAEVYDVTTEIKVEVPDVGTEAMESYCESMEITTEPIVNGANVKIESQDDELGAESISVKTEIEDFETKEHFVEVNEEPTDEMNAEIKVDPFEDLDDHLDADINVDEAQSLDKKDFASQGCAKDTHNCQRNCSQKVSVERRNHIRNHYEKLSYCEKQSWLVEHCKRDKKKKNQHSLSVSKRRPNIKYFLSPDSGGLIRVCQAFFFRSIGLIKQNGHKIISEALDLAKDKKSFAKSKSKKCVGAASTNDKRDGIRQHSKKVISAPSRLRRRDLKGKKDQMTVKADSQDHVGYRDDRNVVCGRGNKTALLIRRRDP